MCTCMRAGVSSHDCSNVFFEIHISGEKAGKVVFKLYDDVVPEVLLHQS